MATINELTAMQMPTNEDNVPVQTGNNNFRVALHNNRCFRSNTTHVASADIKAVVGSLIDEYITRYGLAAGGFTASASWANVPDGITIMGQISEPFAQGYVYVEGIATSRSATYGCIAFKRTFLNGTESLFLTAKIADAMA